MSQSQYKASPVSIKDLRTYAFLLRQAMNMENTLQIDIIRVLEHNMISAFGESFELEVVETHTMPDYALYLPESNKMLIREDVYLAAASMNARHRFTIAHEIGHLLLHRNVKLARSDGERKIYEDPEWQANVFAAEFLAPAHLIGGMSAAEISLAFGISKQAATNRYNSIKEK